MCSTRTSVHGPTVSLPTVSLPHHLRHFRRVYCVLSASYQKQADSRKESAGFDSSPSDIQRVERSRKQHTAVRPARQEASAKASRGYPCCTIIPARLTRIVLESKSKTQHAHAKSTRDFTHAGIFLENKSGSQHARAEPARHFIHANSTVLMPSKPNRASPKRSRTT